MVRLTAQYMCLFLTPLALIGAGAYFLLNKPDEKTITQCPSEKTLVVNNKTYCEIKTSL